MKIGILQTGHAPEPLIAQSGDYDSMFARLLADGGYDLATYNVVDMEFPASQTECDGWLITGSRHGAYEDLPFIAKLERFIRDVYAADIPLVGICFGHQVIAQALGGKVEKFAGGWIVGRQSYDFDGTEVTLNAWHQDQVVERPAQAKVIASNPMCENAALVYGDRAFTVQAHPEFNADFVEGLANTRGRGVVPDPLLDDAIGQLDKPTDNAVLAHKIITFFNQKALAS